MRHRVLIVGGGFGGLAAAKALKRAPVEVTLVDRANHHLFQPLLRLVTLTRWLWSLLARDRGQRVIAPLTDLSKTSRTTEPVTI
jgi:2-polyprenyl-6-methoxyphenol hydroxylase-like FAD-dependent oxidoreductase